MVDANLTWKDQVDKVISKTSATIAMIKHIRSWISQDIALQARHNTLAKRTMGRQYGLHTIFNTTGGKGCKVNIIEDYKHRSEIFKECFQSQCINCNQSLQQLLCKIDKKSESNFIHQA